MKNSPTVYQMFSPSPTSANGNNNRIMEDHLINAQINHSTETMEKDSQMGLSTIRIETGDTLEKFLVLHRIKLEISDRKIQTANQELINLPTLLSAGLTIDRRVVSHLTNKNSHKTITRCHAKWCALLKPTIPLTNYQIFAI